MKRPDRDAVLGYLLTLVLGITGALLLAHFSACEADEAYCFSANDGSEP